MKSYRYALAEISRELRIYITILILQLAAGSLLHSQTSNWRQTNGPYGGVVNAIVSAAGGDVLVASGRLIYHLSGATRKWSLSLNHPSESIETMAIGSTGNLFAATHGKGLYRSTDNGETWVRMNTSFAYLELREVSVSPSGTIFVGIDGNYVFRSTDDGQGWTYAAVTNQECRIRTISADSSGFVVAGTDRGAYRSVTNGASWIPSGLTGIGIGSSLIDLRGNIFLGTAMGIYRSTDRGSTWEPMNTGLGDSLDCCLFETHAGTIMAGTRSGIYSSTNEGQDWVSEGLEGVSIGVLAETPQYELFVGRSGVYSRSESASDWNLIGLPQSSIWCLAADEDDRLYAAVAFDGVWYSSDRGDSWRRTGLRDSYIQSLGTGSSGVVYAGTDGGIYRSRDRGISWTKVDSTMSAVSALLVLSNDTIFAGMEYYGGGIYRSTDAGETWLLSGLPDTGVVAFGMNSHGHLFAGTPRNGIYHSLDHGTTWTKLGLSTEGVTTMAIDSEGNIFTPYSKSTDDGVSWVRMDSAHERGGTVMSLAVNSSGEIFSGSFNGVFISNDGGAHWREIDNGSEPLPVFCFAIDSKDHLFAGSDGSGVYEYVSQPDEVRKQTTIEVRAFTLFQNSPNPFNPSTSINVHLPTASRVTLVVYNLLGQEIITLVSGWRPAGSFVTSFDGSDVPSGVYLYRLTVAGDLARARTFQVTKKMLLIR